MNQAVVTLQPRWNRSSGQTADTPNRNKSSVLVQDRPEQRDPAHADLMLHAVDHFEGSLSCFNDQHHSLRHPRDDKGIGIPQHGGRIEQDHIEVVSSLLNHSTNSLGRHRGIGGGTTTASPGTLGTGVPLISRSSSAVVDQNSIVPEASLANILATPGRRQFKSTSKVRRPAR